ncbi:MULTISPECIES: NADH-quinone oxidoreductase subunit L [Bacteroidota]|uniref:NADH-quinone oxidoreductase subunit L n=1 Tax=Flectobacillus rivi TaxID=2984209 RepID=A0ABT6Z9M5_9BACT|nr:MULTISPECIES: NADH-quinone oxidoreductase subunit L [Bacteroidota]MDI9869856.1 NADH-quinone oxidoreductase subunit L [Flectobacillus roseus]MDI9877582.1 NADH-quinone oxidoreductase subunit L [Flectobacillus rivi]NBB30120.1 NADH-quinone oxidoreductase subunit L [Cellulophaga sp. BC115SP]
MSLAVLIPLFPLIGFLINGLGFRRVPKSLVGVIGSAAALASFACALSLFLNFSGQPEVAHIFDWITIGDLNISMSFQIDQLSLLMLLIITGVGSLIHIYSIGYMHHDEGFGKFFAFLNLFLFFMLLLVLGSNYVVMFIGWEGVGLCSYLLIGFWNKNTNYGNAARKAFIMNRIGDLGFLLGIFLIITHFGTVEYADVFSKVAEGGYESGDKTLMYITLLLFVGAMGKSAQIPLYTWLPDAMAGPTPVSALIHAATMVTAGIYMIIRSNVLYSLSPETLEVIGWVGTATALLAASIGLLQNDIKKVLAYSTVSQLGYMFMGLGVMAYSSSFFHVMTHAFFKALLFLGAGSVIHAMSDEQDIRSMGGLRKKLPITFITFLIATIAISGIPPFAGFFSKDEILAHVYEHNKLMWVLALAGSMMTSFYMFRLLFLTFFGEFRGTHEQEHHLHESPIAMTAPLMILAVLSAAGGFFNLPHIFGGHASLATFMEPLFAQSHVAAHAPDEATEKMLMIVSVIAALVSAAVAYVIYVSKKAVPEADGTETGLQKVVYNKYYIDELYDTVFVKPITALSNILHSFVEFLVIDLIVEGIGKLVKGISGEARLLQNGTTGYYIFAMVISIAVMLIWGLRIFILG